MKKQERMKKLFQMLVLASAIVGCSHQVSVDNCRLYKPVYYDKNQLERLEEILSEKQLERQAVNNKNYEDMCK